MRFLRLRFSHRAALSAMPARGGLNITPGRKGAPWGLLFLHCALLAVAGKGRIIPDLGLPQWWVLWAQSAGVRSLCLAQEDAPDCSHSP